MCASPWCMTPATCTASYGNFPVAIQPPPDPFTSQAVRRHLGMYCGCDLIECIHNEDDPWFADGRRDNDRGHWSGSPASNYRYPWPKGDAWWCAWPASAFTCRQMAQGQAPCERGECAEETLAALA